MIGDYFVANKFVWGYGKHSFSLGRYGDFTALDFELPVGNRIFGREPNRGDIAVFRPVPQNIGLFDRIDNANQTHSQLGATGIPDMRQ